MYFLFFCSVIFEITNHFFKIHENHFMPKKTNETQKYVSHTS